MLYQNDFEVWQIDLTVNGERLRRSTRTKDKKLAEKIHTLTEAELLLGKQGVGANKKDKFTLQDAYKKALEAHFKHLKYLFKVEQNWSLLTSPRGSERPLLDSSLEVSEITAEIIRDLKIALEQSGNSPATINRKMSVLSKVLTLCVDWGKIPHFPRIKIEKELGERHRVLTPEEQVSMMRFFAEHYAEQAGLYEFLLSSGNRLSEALKLTWFDVNFREGTVRFPDTKSGATLLKPMTDSMRSVLEARKNLVKPFPYTVDMCQHYWKLFRRSMGESYVNDEAFVMHSLRHTCGSRLVAKGVDLLRVQLWLGHKSYETTRGYAKVDVSHLKDVVSTINAAEEFDYSLSTLSRISVAGN